MHPAHVDGRFLVPLKGQAPDVGLPAPCFTESLQDEVAELASAHASFVPGAQENPFELIRFGMAVVAMFERRFAKELEEVSKPLPTTARVQLTPEHERRLVAAALGRILDWICKGRGVLDMGPRVFVAASHIRASAVDGRTDQQAAGEIGNDAHGSINMLRSEFHRTFNAEWHTQTEI